MDKELLKILACPDCKSGIVYNQNKQLLKCTKCKKDYKIDNGIPVFYAK